MRVIRLILCVFVFILFAKTSTAQSSADLRKQRERLTREIDLLNKSLQTTSTNKNLTLKQVNALLAQIKLREQKISTINSEVELIDREIRKNTQEIKKLEDQLAELKKKYADMIRFAFRNKSGYNKLMFLFAANDFNQAFKRVKYLQQFSESRKNQAKEIEETQDTLKNKIAELEANKNEKSSLIKAQEDEKQTLGAQKAEKDKVVSGFASQEKEFKSELAKKKQEADRLSRAIQAAIRKEIEEERRREEEARKAAEAVAAAKAKADAEKAAASGKPVEVAPKPAEPKPETKSAANILSATPEAAKLSVDFTSNRGKLPWPVENGIVTQGYGQHTYGRNVTVNNSGLNIRTNDGQAVRAVFNGVVSSVVQMPGGYAVIIRHGKFFTVYSNLHSVSVKKLQTVSVKQTIGVAAKDPIEGTTEIHFEIWEGSAPINPTPWLARN
ncbi:MAG TPA: peptidoglycan DD-metalloendopeptidase family protein [Sphingobacteriaceae bacterium]|nr:peptidoglycan DD-metalloendopeptidase family protein [Sphingobacteriaceae bacterium]